MIREWDPRFEMIVWFNATCKDVVKIENQLLAMYLPEPCRQETARSSTIHFPWSVLCLRVENDAFHTSCFFSLLFLSGPQLLRQKVKSHVRRLYSQERLSTICFLLRTCFLPRFSSSFPNSHHLNFPLPSIDLPHHACMHA